jgi:hypothetical protein
MRVGSNTHRQTAKRAVAALVGLAIISMAVDAQAGEGQWKHGYYGPPGYVMVPPGHVRYYAPVPVYYVPPPVVYAAPVVAYPAPVYYAPAYPSLSLGLNIPLR